MVAGLRPTILPGMPRGTIGWSLIWIEPCELMQRCWLRDKERPTMKEIVQIIENWNPESWDTDVITIAEC